MNYVDKGTTAAMAGFNVGKIKQRWWHKNQEQWVMEGSLGAACFDLPKYHGDRELMTGCWAHGWPKIVWINCLVVGFAVGLGIGLAAGWLAGSSDGMLVDGLADWQLLCDLLGLLLGLLLGWYAGM